LLDLGRHRSRPDGGQRHGPTAGAFSQLFDSAYGQRFHPECTTATFGLICLDPIVNRYRQAGNQIGITVVACVKQRDVDAVIEPVGRE
jgi:hypothetical protein